MIFESYQPRWDRHRARRRPDLEVCLECGREADPDALGEWATVEVIPGPGEPSQVVGFACPDHHHQAGFADYAREWCERVGGER